MVARLTGTPHHTGHAWTVQLKLPVVPCTKQDYKTTWNVS